MTQLSVFNESIVIFQKNIEYIQIFHYDIWTSCVAKLKIIRLLGQVDRPIQ